MLSKKAKANRESLETEIASVLDTLGDTTLDEATYNEHLTKLERLNKLKENYSKGSTDLKDWIPVIASVGQIVLIVAYESSGNIIKSKALSFVSKLRA